MFSITPQDLIRRRERCRASAQSLHGAPRAVHGTCNMCGAAGGAVLAMRDRYGIPGRTILCLRCGLVYLGEPLTPDGYANFYFSGAYRRLTDSFAGHKPGVIALQEDQAEYTKQVTRMLSTVAAGRGFDSVLDIGGSTGDVASAVATRFGCPATVLDPAAEEVVAARAAGLTGIVGSLESYETDEKFDLILLCRSIEHVFDLRASLLKIRKLLKPNGLFYVDAIDIVESCRQIGAVETVTKIDHCFWLSQETAPAIFRSVGFEIMTLDITSRPDMIKYLLRPCEPGGGPQVSEATVHDIVRRLREIGSDWRAWGRGPQGAREHLMRFASRAKARAVAALPLAAPPLPKGSRPV